MWQKGLLLALIRQSAIKYNWERRKTYQDQYHLHIEEVANISLSQSAPSIYPNQHYSIQRSNCMSSRQILEDLWKKKVRMNKNCHVFGTHFSSSLIRSMNRCTKFLTAIALIYRPVFWRHFRLSSLILNTWTVFFFFVWIFVEPGFHLRQTLHRETRNKEES